MGERRKREFPTQARLHALFDYDPETGVFERKVPKKSHKNTDAKYGSIGAGRVTELGYVVVMVDGINFIAGTLAHIYAHGAPPAGKLRYLNGDRLDNRLVNLGVHLEGEADRIRESDITQERLKALFEYSPATGWFRDRGTGERVGHGHGLGYRAIGVDYKKFLEHRLAWLYMTGSWPENDIDHINGRKDDNRWKNLREATRSENNLNKSVRRDNRSGHPGVSRHGSKWRVRFQFGGVVYDGGTHTSLDDAIADYNTLKLRHGGVEE